MTRKQAIKYLTARYQEQCEQYPRTREIPLDLYLARNLRTTLRFHNRDKEPRPKASKSMGAYIWRAELGIPQPLTR